MKATLIKSHPLDRPCVAALHPAPLRELHLPGIWARRLSLARFPEPVPHAPDRLYRAPAQVAYLSVEERIRAVLDGAHHWAELAALRQERVEQFTKVDVPLVFWGRPRVEAEKG